MKSNLKTELKEMLFGKEKLTAWMKVFIRPEPPDEPVFYKEIPWQSNCNVNVPSKENAEKLIKFLTK